MSEEKFSKCRQDIIDDCLVALGYPVVSVFITEDQINKLINYSVRKCSSKACPTFIETLYAGNGVIDVSEYNMETVSSVYDADIGSTSNGEGCNNCGSPLSTCDVCQKLCSYKGLSYNGLLKGDWNNQLYDLLAYQSAKSEMDNLVLRDYKLDSVNGKLYLDNYSGYVTVEYVKSRIELEDIQNDSFWYSWVRDYTVAMVKITEGRIRSKYKVSSGVFEIESDELISEGNTDKQELDEKFNDNIGYWTVVRG